LPSAIGAQFGGKYFTSMCVIRLPRHAASCPVGLGSFMLGGQKYQRKITKDGIFVEQLEVNPARLLPETAFRASC
jgi:fumarate hydratase class I